ncbi:MFS transporter [Burkholderia sp. WAC0059]|uniref:MFS transporter n=1 Tax=Burkholderia sp. WAC0059 TaxID=2066022 RepID=UPI000C7F19DC|nr:MFS transporter [Burkholderia sp. WAC0059]PLZ02853.1 MFS transporter [Burkholderia sp. WAC0059]
MFANRKRLLVYALLFLLLLINYLDRIAMSIAGKPLAAELHLGPVALGYLYSSSLWIYILCLLPAGALTDRFGTRRVIGVAIGLWSVCQILGGCAFGLVSLVAARIGLGVFESPTNAAGNRAIREWAPRNERGSATSAFIMGSYAGPALGAPVVAWLVTRYGWRISFIVTGVLGLAWLTLWLARFRLPEEARWLGAAEREQILARRDMQADRHAARPAGLRGLLASPTMWALALTQGCMTYTQYLFLTWFPTYLQTARGLTILSSGFYTAIPYAVTVVGCLLISMAADRLFDMQALYAGKRRYAVALFLLLSADVLVAPSLRSTPLVIVLFSLSMLASACAMAWNFALTNDLLRSADDAGVAFAALTLGGNLFGIVAPIVTGYVVRATGHFDAAFAIAGVLAIVGAFTVLVFASRPLGGPPVHDRDAAGTSSSSGPSGALHMAQGDL